MKDHKGMRSQDIAILLAILALKKDNRVPLRDGQNQVSHLQNKILAELLNISPAEVSGSLRRSAYAGLIDEISSGKFVLKQALLDFLKFGIKYVFPVQPGRLTRGVPTAHSAEPLRSQLSFQEEVVWAHPEGSIRGQAIEPLFPSMPSIAGKNDLLYELLSLTDALRVGGARERELATIELEKRFFQ